MQHHEDALSVREVELSAPALKCIRNTILLTQGNLADASNLGRLERP